MAQHLRHRPQPAPRRVVPALVLVGLRRADVPAQVLSAAGVVARQRGARDADAHLPRRNRRDLLLAPENLVASARHRELVKYTVR